MIRVALFFLFMMIVILSLPVGIQIEFTATSRKYRWMAAGFRIPFRPKPIASSCSRKSRTRRSGHDAARPAGSSILGWFRALRTLGPEGLFDLGNSLRPLLRCIRFRASDLNLTIATPDPALTGLAYGVACGATLFFPAMRNVDIGADFTGRSPYVCGRLELSVIPARALTEVTRLAWSKFVRNPEFGRRLLRAIRKTRSTYV